MFERFTDRARRVLVLAQEEARLLDHNFIGTEHILLGLIGEGEGVAAKALEALGVSLDTARGTVGEIIGTANPAAWTGSPPFTPGAKKVMELSLREALQLGHNYIGTEHLLLGLVREGEGVGCQVLANLGIELPRARQQVIALLSGGGLLEQRRAPAATSGLGQARAPARMGRVWRRATAVRPRRPVEPIPASYATSGEITLAYLDGHLTGSVAAKPVDLGLRVPASEGTAEGRFAGVEVSVRWHLADNRIWHPDVPASLHGTFSGAPVSLLAWFHLDPGHAFDDASIQGELAALPVTAFVLTGDYAEQPGSFGAHGVFADSDFSVRGSAGRAGAELEGSVSGQPVRLRADSRSSPAAGSRALYVTGTYDGPLPLLLLMTGVLIFFV
jgi:hypothetical protein